MNGHLKNSHDENEYPCDDDLDPDFSLVIQNVQENFDYLYEHFGLNMTLKIHVILHILASTSA